MTLACDPYDDDAAFRFACRAELRWGLTMREAQLLFLTCCGHTGRGELARRAGITVPAVRDHRTRLYEKLGATDTLQAVLGAWPLYLEARKEPAR